METYIAPKIKVRKMNAAGGLLAASGPTDISNGNPGTAPAKLNSFSSWQDDATVTEEVSWE